MFGHYFDSLDEWLSVHNIPDPLGVLAAILIASWQIAGHLGPSSIICFHELLTFKGQILSCGLSSCGEYSWGKPWAEIKAFWIKISRDFNLVQKKRWFLKHLRLLHSWTVIPNSNYHGCSWTDPFGHFPKGNGPLLKQKIKLLSFSTFSN